MKRNIEIKKGSALKALGKLLGYMAHYYKWELTLVVFCIIVNAVAGISSSVFLEKLVDEVITPGLSLGFDAVKSKLAVMVGIMGGIYTFPVVALSNIAQASAVMAFVFVNRKDAKAREVGIPSFISGYLGVTEPAMFGVNLKYLYPFVGAMLTSGVMGIVSRLFGVIANSVGVGGLPAFLSMRGDKILVYILCIVIDIALAFLITVVLSKTKLKDMGVHYESGK